jgi:DNA-binding response OmpR family regulator
MPLHASQRMTAQWTLTLRFALYPLPSIISLMDTSNTSPLVNNKKILIVEDDNGLAQVYETRLITEGFTVKRVSNGEEALSAAQAFHPDLIMLDVMMPRINGFDVLDILRNTEETAATRVIMLTALGRPEDIEQAKKYGIEDYLIKSQVTMSEVVTKVKSALGIA